MRDTQTQSAETPDVLFLRGAPIAALVCGTRNHHVLLDMQASKVPTNGEACKVHRSHAICGSDWVVPRAASSQHIQRIGGERRHLRAWQATSLRSGRLGTVSEFAVDTARPAVGAAHIDRHGATVMLRCRQTSRLAARGQRGGADGEEAGEGGARTDEEEALLHTRKRGRASAAARA